MDNTTNLWEKFNPSKIWNAVFNEANRAIKVVNADGTAVGSGAANADGDAFTANTSEGTAAMGVYESTPSTVTDGDMAVVGIDNKRNVKTTLATGGVRTVDTISVAHATDVIMNDKTELTPKFICISVATLGNNTVLAAVTGKKIRVLSGHLSFSGTCNLKFQSGAGGTDITKLYYGVANTQVPIYFSPVGHFETASATLLNANLSAAVAVDINLCYVEV